MSTEILRFYHVEKSPTIDILYQLLNKTYHSGKTAQILSPDDESSEKLCAQLWRYNQNSLFLPISNVKDNYHDIVPRILINSDFSHQYDYLFLNAYGSLQDNPDIFTKFERVFLIFDGHEETQLSWGRQAWRDGKEYRDQHDDSNLTLEYWKQNDAKGWQLQQ